MKIAPLIDIDDSKLDSILNNIEKREKGALVYIEAITRLGQIDRNIAIELLVLLVKEKLLIPTYKIYCPECRESSKKTYSNINEALKEGVCETCANDVCQIHDLNAIDFLFQKC